MHVPAVPRSLSGLRAGTERQHGTSGRHCYQLFGAHVIEAAWYHSDTSGAVIAGWRSAFLRPCGDAVRPKF